MASIKDFTTIDMFCGVGGLTHGLLKEGIPVVAGYDFDKSCKYAFEKNNNSVFITKDIKEVTSDEVNSFFGKKRKILVGCAPCQPFSLYTNRKKTSENDKWALLYSLARLIKEVQPEIVSMENVPQLEHFEEGKVLKDFIKVLKDDKYHVTYKVVNAQDYGVPQRRKRLILLASKHGEIKIITPTHNKDNFKTVRKAIGHLTPIEDGVPDPNDALHRARKLTDLNKKRIQATREGGFWREWDRSLWLECHKKESGKSFRSVYGRMVWEEVSPTMTTYCVGLGNGRFGHPEQDRAISLREAAIFQSFPEKYDFINPEIPFSSATIARQIGNAVPVDLGAAIGASIKKHLENLNIIAHDRR
jgi:DNA (cytosine-5)-methyltransferase 1